MAYLILGACIALDVSVVSEATTTCGLLRTGCPRDDLRMRPGVRRTRGRPPTRRLGAAGAPPPIVTGSNRSLTKAS